MDFEKTTLKRVMEVQRTEDGVAVPVEILEGKFQAVIGPRDTIDQMREEMHQWVDRKFNELIQADVAIMPKRVRELEQLRIDGFFEPQGPYTASGAVQDFIKASGAFDGEVELTHRGKTVRVPKPDDV